MPQFGWTLIIVGLLITAVGLLWLLVPLGRLPGDLVFDRGGVRIYFPIVTCLVLSALLSGVFWLIRHFSR